MFTQIITLATDVPVTQHVWVGEVAARRRLAHFHFDPTQYPSGSRFWLDVTADTTSVPVILQIHLSDPNGILLVEYDENRNTLESISSEFVPVDGGLYSLDVYAQAQNLSDQFFVGRQIGKFSSNIRITWGD